ncbi:MAG TPA: glycosyltransferase family 9 protein [Candidatus Eremiobacteraceae bacterium]|nr:glycosyltransferase family 9 protein [Candidatus Eremiobacteraceae bacterium]
MKILAACTGGGVGDLLAALPALQALHRHFGVRVDVLATPYAASILEGQACVANVFSDDGSTPLRVAAERLRLRGYTHAIVFWSNPRIAALLARAAIPVRVGQSRRLYSFRYTTRVPVRTETGDTTSHWTDIQMDYARALGVRPQARDYSVNLPLTDEDKADAQRVLDTLALRGPFVMLHAVRGVSSQKAGWPTATFAALGDKLAEEFSAPVLLTGTADERRIAQRIGSTMRRPVYNAAGLSTLRGLAALAQAALVVVALDSGPMHIAAAVGAPTVGIFALRTDLPNRWRPLGPRVAVIEPSYACPAWCKKETCRSFACCAALSVDDITAKARSLTTQAPAEIAL